MRFRLESATFTRRISCADSAFRAGRKGPSHERGNMSGTRRAILKTGGAAILVLGAGAAGFALTRAPSAARAPWSAAAKGFGDRRLDALAFAILAPNPHNMQPWRVKLEGEDGFALYADLSRLLPQTDPPNRQITIGFGAFLELFRQAAAEKGAGVEIALFPEGEPEGGLDERPIARARLIGEAVPDPLFAHALARRTNRVPYEAREVARDSLDRVRQATLAGVFAGTSLEPALNDELKALCEAAWRIEWTLDRTRRETIGVTRIGKKEINDAPYGIALAGPLLEGLGAVGVLTREKMDQPGTSAYEQTLLTYIDALKASPAFIWTTTPTNRRADQIEAGRAWVRLQLAATREGLAFQPLSQALQEFPEMREHYARAHALLAPGGGIVQMLARLGYAKAAPPAPREPLEAQLIAS
jgi:nitroreductase